jgi:hypothetical protein
VADVVALNMVSQTIESGGKPDVARSPRHRTHAASSSPALRPGRQPASAVPPAPAGTAGTLSSGEQASGGSGGGSNGGAIAGAVIGVLAACALAAGLFVWCRRRKQARIIAAGQASLEAGSAGGWDDGATSLRSKFGAAKPGGGGKAGVHVTAYDAGAQRAWRASLPSFLPPARLHGRSPSAAAPAACCAHLLALVRRRWRHPRRRALPGRRHRPAGRLVGGSRRAALDWVPARAAAPAACRAHQHAPLDGHAHAGERGRWAGVFVRRLRRAPRLRCLPGLPPPLPAADRPGAALPAWPPQAMHAIPVVDLSRPPPPSWQADEDGTQPQPQLSARSAAASEDTASAGHYERWGGEGG